MKSSLLPILAFGVGLTAADAVVGFGDTNIEVPRFTELSFEPKREKNTNQAAVTALEQESKQPTATDSIG